MAKKTTTLTLDEELVKKAKKLNINISELAETVLKGFTFEPSDLEENVLDKKHKELINAILPILKQQKINVHIGFYCEDDPSYFPSMDIFLFSDGKFYVENINEGDYNIINSDSEDFCFDSPKKILSNLIKAIDERKEKRKGELKEIEMVKRIVEALYPSFAKK